MRSVSATLGADVERSGDRVVNCRCGDTHQARDTGVPCDYCHTTTFDFHRVCPLCRPAEALEQHADAIGALVAEHAP